MKSKLHGWLAMAVVTAFFAGSTLEIQAQTKKNAEPVAAEAAAKTIDPNRKLPFYAKVAAVDKTNKTLKIGNRVFKIMPDTKIVKNEKPGTLDDAKVGEISSGSYKNNNGVLELVMIRFGPKADPKEIAKAEATVPAKK